MTSEARVATPKAAVYMKQLCRHFGHKNPATFSDSSGRIEFEFGVCELDASQGTLVLRALADDGEVMARIYGHVLHRFEATDLLMYEVDTAEEHRRKGAAREIIAFLKRLAVQRGWREIWVLTDVDNDAGNGLYRSAGGTLENSPANMYVFKTSI